MASDDWNPQYEEYDAEFNTLREEMDALGIGASFKPLIPYENWGRYRPSKRTSIVRNARRDNKLAIDRANKAAAEAAAASEAGSSQARPSVRDRSNTRSPMLAMLTLCCLAQRSGSLTALARWSRARRRILPPRRARPVAAQLVGARVGRISTCATCGETRPTLRTGRALAHLRSCVCGCSSRAVCVELAPLRGFQCKNLAVGQHHTARERRLSSDAPEPALRRSGPRADGKGGD